MRKRNVGARHQQIIGKSYQCNTAVPRRDRPDAMGRDRPPIAPRSGGPRRNRVM
ncbi:MAG: hypothetical protein AB4352_00295 [Hormoscilla sp.]